MRDTKGSHLPSPETQTSSTIREGHGADIKVRGVSHAFSTVNGGGTLALDNVSFNVPSGQFVALVGASGCGKTTILNMLGGLISPLSGSVTIDGDEVKQPTRHTGYMFARDALLPWRTALSNVETGLEIRGLKKSQRRSRALESLGLLGLSDFTHAYPRQLSQGMRQRVAIARTLAMNPDTLLMDEPFAALDAQTRIRVQDEFTKIWETSKKTVVFVTHDLSEAVLMADRVIVLAPRPGRIIADIPIGLERPRSVEVLRFSDEYQHLHEQVWQALKEGESN